MNHIEIIIDPEAEKSPQRFNSKTIRNRIANFCLQILTKTNIDGQEVGLLFTDDEGIRKLNRQWRRQDKPTDVLSFAQHCESGSHISADDSSLTPMGDIIISYETVVRNSRNCNISFDEELRRVIIHGLLHLEGMEHPQDNYENGMLKLQEVLLNDSDRIIERDC